MSPRTVSKLRDKLQNALAKEKFAEAIALYEQLSALEPKEPRWSHRRGDVHRRMGDDRAAAVHYSLAVEKYTKLGFVARAAALAKLVVTIDPSRDALIDSVAAQRPEPSIAAPPQPTQGPRQEPTQEPPRVAPAPPPIAPPPPAPPPIAPRSAQVTPPLPPAPPLPRALVPPPLPRRQRRRTSSLQMLALDLVPDETREDEVTFLEEEDVVAIELSDHDLSPRRATRRATMDLSLDDIMMADADEEPDRVDRELLHEMPSAPLFDDLPKAVLAELITASDVIDLEDNVEIDASSSLWILVEGQAELRDQRGRRWRFGEGDVIGEASILEGAPPVAHAKTVSPVRALRFSKRALRDLAARFPEVSAALLELLGRRLLASLLLTSPLFDGFDETARKALGSMFEVRSADAGLQIMVEGRRGDGLYCLLDGALERRDAEGVARLLPGTILGEEALAAHAPLSASTVQCTEPSLLLRLPSSKFMQIAAMYPAVMAKLSAR